MSRVTDSVSSVGFDFMHDDQEDLLSLMPSIPTPMKLQLYFQQSSHVLEFLGLSIDTPVELYFTVPRAYRTQKRGGKFFER